MGGKIEKKTSDGKEVHFRILPRQQNGLRPTLAASNKPILKLTDVIFRYPLYEFIGDVSFSKTASVSSRYSDESLRAIILDIHFLSLSDYLVCTFSSQVR